MAIVSVKEIHTGRGGDATVGKKSVRKHSRSFRVVTNSPYDGSYEALMAPGIPGAGSRHPSDPFAFANHAKADPDSKSKFVWIVTVDYTTERERSENPLADPVSFEWDTDTRMEPFYFDKDGAAILNAAGDYFEDTVKDEVSFWSVTATANMPYVPSWINNYRDAVNSDSIFLDGISLSPGMAKIKKIKIGKWQTRNDIQYREVQLTIKIQGSWKKYVLNQGLRCIKDGKLVRCVDGKNQPATRPMLLNGDGTQMSLPVSNPASVTPLEFDLRNMQPFSYLGF